jgi:hypothetical protein
MVMDIIDPAISMVRSIHRRMLIERDGSWMMCESITGEF